MKVKTYEVPLYYLTLRIVIAKDFNKALKKNNLEFNEDVNKHGAFMWDESQDIILFIRPDIDIPLITHESVHVTNEIFKRRGIKLDIENDEPQAYLCMWVAKTIEESLK